MKKTIFLSLCLLVSASYVFGNFSIQKMQVNYQTTPIGADLTIPQFSWQIKALDSKGVSKK